MRILLFLLFTILCFCAQGQEMVKDTFTDAVGGRYAVTGYYVSDQNEFSILPKSKGGYYVTNRELKNEWLFLTKSFAKENYKLSEMVYSKDAVNLSLTEILNAKDTIIVSLQKSVLFEKNLREQSETICAAQKQSIMTEYLATSKARNELDLKLSKYKDKNKQIIGLGLGGLFIGFLVGVFAIK